MERPIFMARAIYCGSPSCCLKIADMAGKAMAVLNQLVFQPGQFSDVLSG